jgi:hypothetical protein
MAMRCLCSGPYPSIEEQAARLCIEDAAGGKTMADYIAVVEGVNEYLLGLLVRRMRERHRDLYGW